MVKKFSNPGRHPKVKDKTLTDSQLVRHMKNGALLRKERWGDRYIIWGVIVGKRKNKLYPWTQMYRMSPWRAKKDNYYVMTEQVSRLVCAGRLTIDKQGHFVVKS